MEKEGFFSGYCRVLDGSRTVCAVVSDGTLEEADCSFPDCPHAPDCPIAVSIRDFCKENGAILYEN